MTTEEPNHLEAQTREPNNFCEVAGQQCFQNYCDENGCQDRKRRYTALGISLLHNNDLLKHLLENLANQEQSELVVAELTARLAAPVVESREGEVSFLRSALGVRESEIENNCMTLSELPGVRELAELVAEANAQELQTELDLYVREVSKVLYAALSAAPVVESRPVEAERVFDEVREVLTYDGNGGCDYELVKRFDELTAKALTALSAAPVATAEAAAPQWVPVGERLPESGKPVLVIRTNGEQSVAWRGRSQTDPDKIGFWGGYQSEVPATHWMPLPAAPVTLEGEPAQ